MSKVPTHTRASAPNGTLLYPRSCLPLSDCAWLFADLHLCLCAEPLYTLLGQASELSYAMLENIRAIAVRHPHIFEKDFKHFFVKYVRGPW